MSFDPMMILNGEFIAEKEASVSPLNRGMMYGDGCFETLRFYSGKLLHWHQHFDRLVNGLNYLGMKANFSSEELKKSIIRLAHLNQLSEKEAFIRIQCWREGGRGYKPTSTQINRMVQIAEISPQNNPLTLAVADTRCIPNRALSRRYKLSNGLNYIKAAQEANASNMDDALMLTVDGKISETISANIFWIKENSVFTPSDKCDLLPGVTRSIVLKICEELGVQVKEGNFILQDLADAEVVFCTNSLIEIRNVSAIDEMGYDYEHAILEKIRTGFEVYKEEYLKE